MEHRKSRKLSKAPVSRKSVSGWTVGSSIVPKKLLHRLPSSVKEWKTAHVSLWLEQVLGDPSELFFLFESVRSRNLSGLDLLSMAQNDSAFEEFGLTTFFKEKMKVCVNELVQYQVKLEIDLEQKRNRENQIINYFEKRQQERTGDVSFELPMKMEDWDTVDLYIFLKRPEFKSMPNVTKMIILQQLNGKQLVEACITAESSFLDPKGQAAMKAMRTMGFGESSFDEENARKFVTTFLQQYRLRETKSFIHDFLDEDFAIARKAAAKRKLEEEAERLAAEAANNQNLNETFNAVHAWNKVMMGRVLKRDPERIAIETPRVVVKRHTINNTTKSSQSMTPYPPANGAHRGKAGIRNTMYSNVPLHENSGDMLQEEVAKEKNLLSKLVQKYRKLPKAFKIDSKSVDSQQGNSHTAAASSAQGQGDSVAVKDEVNAETESAVAHHDEPLSSATAHAEETTTHPIPQSAVNLPRPQEPKQSLLHSLLAHHLIMLLRNAMKPSKYVINDEIKARIYLGLGDLASDSDERYDERVRALNELNIHVFHQTMEKIQESVRVQQEERELQASIAAAAANAVRAATADTERSNDLQTLRIDTTQLHGGVHQIVRNHANGNGRAQQPRSPMSAFDDSVVASTYTGDDRTENQENATDLQYFPPYSAPRTAKSRGSTSYSTPSSRQSAVSRVVDLTFPDNATDSGMSENNNLIPEILLSPLESGVFRKYATPESLRGKWQYDVAIETVPPVSPSAGSFTAGGGGSPLRSGNQSLEVVDWKHHSLFNISSSTANNATNTAVAEGKKTYLRQRYPLQLMDAYTHEISFDPFSMSLCLSTYDRDFLLEELEVYVSSIYVTPSVFVDFITIRTCDLSLVPNGYLGSITTEQWVKLEQEMRIAMVYYMNEYHALQKLKKLHQKRNKEKEKQIRLEKRLSMVEEIAEGLAADKDSHASRGEVTHSVEVRAAASNDDVVTKKLENLSLLYDESSLATRLDSIDISKTGTRSAVIGDVRVNAACYPTIYEYSVDYPINTLLENVREEDALPSSTLLLRGNDRNGSQQQSDATTASNTDIATFSSSQTAMLSTGGAGGSGGGGGLGSSEKHVTIYCTQTAEHGTAHKSPFIIPHPPTAHHPRTHNAANHRPFHATAANTLLHQTTAQTLTRYHRLITEIPTLCRFYQEQAEYFRTLNAQLNESSELSSGSFNGSILHRNPIFAANLQKMGICTADNGIRGSGGFNNDITNAPRFHSKLQGYEANGYVAYGDAVSFQLKGIRKKVKTNIILHQNSKFKRRIDYHNSMVLGSSQFNSWDKETSQELGSSSLELQSHGGEEEGRGESPLNISAADEDVRMRSDPGIALSPDNDDAGGGEGGLSAQSNNCNSGMRRGSMVLSDDLSDDEEAAATTGVNTTDSSKRTKRMTTMRATRRIANEDIQLNGAFKRLWTATEGKIIHYQLVMLIESRRTMQIYFLRKFQHLDVIVNVYDSVADATRAIQSHPEVYSVLFINFDDLLKPDAYNASDGEEEDALHHTLSTLFPSNVDARLYSTVVYDVHEARYGKGALENDIAANPSAIEERLEMLDLYDVACVLEGPYSTESLQMCCENHAAKIKHLL